MFNEQPMGNDILIYGANGYTAELIIELAVAQGAKPILAGRSREKIKPLAERFGLPMRNFAIDDAEVVARNLVGAAAVINCAGPFLRTAKGMATGCMKAGAHYLDITGEIEVFEAMVALGKKAEAAGVMLMPGTGFDVVPSDCLAAHLAFKAIGRPSHGTATTMVENLHKGGAIRRNGTLVKVPAAWKVRSIDFGHGPTTVMSIAWGDVATAYHSTGIPNIEVYMAAPVSFARDVTHGALSARADAIGRCAKFPQGQDRRRPRRPQRRTAQERSLFFVGRGAQRRGQIRLRAA
jgi:short subunit dehydrogenase-like uncharacterized protein